MIKKLRRKFIAATMASLSVVLLIILGGVNLMSYQKVVADADAVLDVLVENGGSFPKPQGVKGEEAPSGDAPAPEEEKHLLTHRGLSPETPYESRYFWVLLDENGACVDTDTGQIAAVDEETAQLAASQVWAASDGGGFWGNYRYRICTEGENSRVIFLDCGQTLSGFRTTLLARVALSLVGLLAVFMLLLILSKRIVRPVTESYEKQKRFITDAGHELKTPLTIIGADLDLAEMECGENQWLTDIRRQVKRLTGLTHDLIYLSRMEEGQEMLSAIEFPISDVVEEMAQSFAAPAQSQHKEFRVQVQPMLSYTGDEKAIRQLVSILLDNALKYSGSGGCIEVRLEKQNHALLLSVRNTTTQPVEKDQLPRLFDRFYRLDSSRNKQTGGYGLGLSIAKSIVSLHKGKIRAESPDPKTLLMIVSLPV